MLLTVTQVVHYTDRLFCIRTERPASFKFAAGQFTMIGMPGEKLMRAYSITSSPYDDFIEFYSIKIQDGALTSKLQHINVGDQLNVGDKPVGSLTTSSLELGGDLWMLATGTGIAPFISLLRDPFTYDLFNKLHVVWSVRDEIELTAYDSFLKQQEIEYIPIVTQDPLWNGVSTRITTIVQEGIVIPVLMPTTDKVVVCGNMSFNNDIKSVLTTRGFVEGSGKAAGTFVQEKAFVG